jgi:hypothetical protein
LRTLTRVNTTSAVVKKSTYVTTLNRRQENVEGSTGVGKKGKFKAERNAPQKTERENDEKSKEHEKGTVKV